MNDFDMRYSFLHFSQMKDFDMGDKFSPFLHDAVLLYANAVNDTLKKGLDPRKGLVVANEMKGRVFRGKKM